MALQNAEKRCSRSDQKGNYIQQVTDVPGIFAHVFADKVPALLAWKSRVPHIERHRDPGSTHGFAANLVNDHDVDQGVIHLYDLERSWRTRWLSGCRRLATRQSALTQRFEPSIT
jgi:hypothetical protein